MADTFELISFIFFQRFAAVMKRHEYYQFDDSKSHKIDVVYPYPTIMSNILKIIFKTRHEYYQFDGSESANSSNHIVSAIRDVVYQ